MEFVFGLRPKVLQILLQHNPKIVEQLAKTAENLHKDYKSVFTNKHLPSFGCCMQPRVDDIHGKVV